MTGWPVASFCEMAAVRARMRCRTRAVTPSMVRPAVALESELSFEGVVDRTCRSSPWPRPGRTRPAGGAGCRPGGAAAPRTSGNGRRSTRTAPSGQLRALDGLPRAGALDRGGVHDPHVVGLQAGAGAGAGGQDADAVPDQAAGGAEPLVVAGLLRQVGEQVPQVRTRVRIQRASEVNPSRACSTARMTSSASLSCGDLPATGRHGASWGDSFSRSSVLTYSAVAGVSRLFVTQRSWTPSPRLICAGNP